MRSSYLSCVLLLALMGGSCRADFESDFPDALKRTAFEEIIGNYYLFDPFLQPGRGGRELESNFDSFTHPNSVPTRETSEVEDDDDSSADPTLYSIPPAITPAVAKDQMTQDDGIPVTVSRVPAHRDLVQITDHQEKQQMVETATQKAAVNDEEYPLYPPFLTQESVRQPQQLVSVPVKNRHLPRYVIGVAGKNRVDRADPFRPSGRHHPAIYRDQIVNKNDADVQLDESPFAKRSSFPNYFDGLWRPIEDDGVLGGGRVRRYNVESHQPIRGIRNGYYSPFFQ